MERHINNSIASSSPSSPTTFVEADTNSFRDLVQKLTGLAGDNSSEKIPVTLPSKLSSKLSHPVDPTGPRRSPFKLQERRQHTIRKLEIKLGLSKKINHRFESPAPSPVTPLSPELLFFRSPGTESPSSPLFPAAVSEEEKAIAEKGFFWHPSPMTTPRGNEPPELLTLFPLSSPSQRNQD